MAQLLSKGGSAVDVNAQNEYGHTALHEVAGVSADAVPSQDRIAVVDKLLEYGAIPLTQPQLLDAYDTEFERQGHAPTRSEASRRRRGASVERSATLYVYCLLCYFATELLCCSS